LTHEVLFTDHRDFPRGIPAPTPLRGESGIRSGRKYKSEQCNPGTTGVPQACSPVLAIAQVEAGQLEVVRTGAAGHLAMLAAPHPAASVSLA
jgi:hypothetical protein